MGVVSCEEMAMEIREASPSHLLIKIQSFSLLEKCGLEKYETKDFAAGNFKWRLVIYPNGHGTENPGEYVSVYLAVSGTNYLPEVNAVFSIFIFNQTEGNYLYAPGKTRRFFKLQTEWGYPNFISKKIFTHPSNGYLVDDNCIFGAEVFVQENRAVTQCLTLKNVIVPYNHVFEISNFSAINGSRWFSEEFTVGGYKWKVELFPNGNCVEKDRSLSIYLICASLADDGSRDERVKTSYSICMKNQYDLSKDHKRTTNSYWFPPPVRTYGHGWTSFLLLASFKQPKGGFLVDNRCLLEIELYVQAAEQ